MQAAALYNCNFKVLATNSNMQIYKGYILHCSLL